jgi:mannosyltransferase OCH1-like enzyme
MFDFSRNQKQIFQKNNPNNNLIVKHNTVPSKMPKVMFFMNQTAIVERKIQPIVPLKIFQTWFSKELPPLMQKCVEELKTNNPEFEFFLFDDNECRSFIETHFDEEVVNAFDTLVPGAYKADLWRYCVLYIHGGIYLDVKYKCVNDFRLISLTEKEWFVKDMETSGKGIYNALMISKPKNPLYKQFIDKVTYNVQNRYYGDSSLSPTGPNMLKQFFTQRTIDSLQLIHVFQGGYCIFDTRTSKPILKIYDHYRLDQRNNTNNKKYYSNMWDKGEIYGDD